MLFVRVVPIVVVALGTVACSRDPHNAVADAPPPVAVRAVQARAADVPLDVFGIGNVEAVSTVDVKPRITGQIQHVYFQEGHDVAKGSLLFEIDPEPLNRQITEIEANIARDAANEKQAIATIAKDQATLRNAQSVADRGTKLASEGIFSREQSEQVVSAAESAKAAIDADRAGVESAQAALRADRARLQQTRLQLGYTKILAPIAGRAGSIPVKEGNVAKENDTTLVTLLQISPVYVSFSVPENMLPAVRQLTGNHVLTVYAEPANGTPVAGQLRFIDSAVDATTGTIKLKALFQNQARNLWPGQFVNVRTRLSTEHDRILVPAQTIQTGPCGKYVWLMKPDHTVTMQPVQVLRNFNEPGQVEQAVIGSGLQAGDRVISEGQVHLLPGAHVRLMS